MSDEVEITATVSDDGNDDKEGDNIVVVTDSGSSDAIVDLATTVGEQQAQIEQLTEDVSDAKVSADVAAIVAEAALDEATAEPEPTVIVEEPEPEPEPEPDEEPRRTHWFWRTYDEWRGR